MKRTFLLLGLSAMLFTGCSEDDPAPVNNEPNNSDNKVLLLKVDLLTNAFEGGKELVFPEAETFTIATEYVAPGDFGSLKLTYEEVNQPIFEGTITWMGVGERSYPATLLNPDGFDTVEEAVEMPSLSDFQYVDYIDEGEDVVVDPEFANIQSVWAAIDNLELVKTYRESNPEAKVNFFLYTPSVGVGNPEEWDWYIILKN